MSNRQDRPARQIRGPQSALTDFLASQNISANRIRADAEARRNAAAAANNQGGSNGTANTANGATATGDVDDDNEEEAAEVQVPSAARSRAEAQKRKRQAEAIDKIQKSKAFKRRKRNNEDSDSDDLARAIFQEKSAPLPGQMENCEICDKRFTVTPYSRAGPNGGLLCSKCSKDFAKDDEGVNKLKKKKSGPAGASRRKLQSRILDGMYAVGAKSLMTLCIETLAKNIELASDLGDLPPFLVDRIARILSKRRLLTSQCLDLFLQPNTEDVTVYDGSYLTANDYIRIFQTASRLKNLKLRNAVQFKDEVMMYLISRNLVLHSIHLHGANLLSEDSWNAYLEAKGKTLQSLQVYYTDKHFGNGVVATLKDRCPKLKRLKIAHNQKVTNDGVEHIAKLEGLEHLSLKLLQPKATEPYIKVVQGIGQGLCTLSLKDVPDLDDRVLDAIHEHCRSLSKLRITDSEVMTDAGFARLFKDWANKPLLFVDFQKCRHVDSTKPRENPHMVGLCSDGFRALMKHSGKRLRYLNIHACRHISREAFEEMFSDTEVYPDLLELEISFCENVTDFVVGSIFRSCPKLKELNVFGCMKVKEVRVPKGKILVGVPNAVGMIIEGSDNDSVPQAGMPCTRSDTANDKINGATKQD
ncbi:uncharacterized protein BCR38DRAFT_359406 [Pseudomassariella vexata]|uniref:DNA repair protein rhp7 treble clef domain-containing protein n=1 Tax=Pseudomassariella vexata TaxID=1141098 RepID=A0A1Y2EJH3_9PEZI|nr:uncharacterized protein BCR38DRAFT_359406 [Pseudomassariella vexata]ORY71713.1 hypothetical protein BCR38DRAFT_359406 [Pseudomassariella vexata]